MDALRYFWKDKRILVTGHEGFLGANLTKRLLQDNARVTGVDIDIRRKNTIFTADDYRKINNIKADVRNYSVLKRIILNNRIEIIFHLAAEAIVDRAFVYPLNTFNSNIAGTWNILEACRGVRGIKSIVIASSDKAYGSHKDLPYTEDTPLTGINPYDVSKSCGDLLAFTYSHAYDLPVAVTRCGNIYGPGDFNFSRIVPDAVRCALSGRKLLIRSNGRFTRDYVYVEDIVNGYLRLAYKLYRFNLAGEAFNFSDENPLDVITLVKRIYAVLDKKPAYRILNKAKYEIKHQYLSSKKARKVLGWKPAFSLDKGLRNTIDWYKTKYLLITKFQETIIK